MSFSESSVSDFVEALGSDSPTPGGGSAAAVCAAMSAGLCGMVARITLRKEARREARPVMEQIRSRADELAEQLTGLAQADADAYSELMKALGVPRDGGGDAALRAEAVQRAAVRAAEVPLQVLGVCEELSELAARALKHGSPVVATDAASAAVLALAAAQAAACNVRVNLLSMTDRSYTGRKDAEVSRMLDSVGNRVSGVQDSLSACLKKR